MCETISVRCSVHLMKKKDAGYLMDDPTRVRPVTQLSAKERKELTTPYQEGPVFQKWIDFYELKWDKKKQTDYQFAAECFVTFQNHFTTIDIRIIALNIGRIGCGRYCCVNATTFTGLLSFGILQDVLSVTG